MQYRFAVNFGHSIGCLDQQQKLGFVVKLPCGHEPNLYLELVQVTGGRVEEGRGLLGEVGALGRGDILHRNS